MKECLVDCQLCGTKKDISSACPNKKCPSHKQVVFQK